MKKLLYSECIFLMGGLAVCWHNNKTKQNTWTSKTFTCGSIVNHATVRGLHCYLCWSFIAFFFCTKQKGLATAIFGGCFAWLQDLYLQHCGPCRLILLLSVCKFPSFLLVYQTEKAWQILVAALQEFRTSQWLAACGIVDHVSWFYCYLCASFLAFFLCTKQKRPGRKFWWLFCRTSRLLFAALWTM